MWCEHVRDGLQAVVSKCLLVYGFICVRTRFYTNAKNPFDRDAPRQLRCQAANSRLKGAGISGHSDSEQSKFSVNPYLLESMGAFILYYWDQTPCAHHDFRPDFEIATRVFFISGTIYK